MECGPLMNPPAFFVRPKRASAGLDMAPLIDVVFLLLIFFMLTSSFLQPTIPLALPKAAASEDPPPAPVFVSVDANGAVYINQDAVPRDNFAAALGSLLAGREDRTVNFRGDRAMPYEIFVGLMDEARQAGATRFNIVHESK
ncbi:MAG: biopolymer transporter ExbD [Chthoniobacterales bacterium]|nr:biopolymer transporter ExbD [Chthoniobacterales bacterium]